MNTNNNTNNTNNNNNKTDILNSFHQNMYYVTSNQPPCSCVTLSFYQLGDFFTMVRCFILIPWLVAQVPILRFDIMGRPC